MRDVKSDLLEEADKIPFDQLCRRMQIVQGSEEYLKPLNIALMLFNSNPERFFPYARIEIVEFHDEIGDSFSEKIFKGPIHIQLKESLRYLQSMFLREEVRKRPDRAEADRFYNYPYVALEEALANAVYHKDYAQREPIEISIRPDRIEILSFPGPLPPLKTDDLNKGAARVRTYRNRRIGDFLKELHMTEGRCTGVPKIHRAMERNGSPPAIFETDEDCLYFLTILPIHKEAIRKVSSNVGVLTTETHQLPGVLTTETHQLPGVLTTETHQLPGVLTTETHQLPGVLTTEMLPEELRMLINNFNGRPGSKELRLVIQKLCGWRELTAHQIAELLKRKDKKHLVRSCLTPMIKSGELKYAHSEIKNFQNQAYTIGAISL